MIKTFDVKLDSGEVNRSGMIIILDLYKRSR